MATVPAPAATLDDLMRHDGRAELVAGRIVPLRPFGRFPARIVGRIARSLDDHAEATGRGEAYTGGIAYAVGRLASGRQSVSPDASYFLGPFPEDGMKFLVGAPHFAVEVRSENDYGPSAEAEMAAKRLDYFEAGTLVVWDVDPEARAILKYEATAPDRPARFEPGATADAEPAVPGWRLAVDRIFA